QLVDRLGVPISGSLNIALTSRSANQRIGAMWALFNMGALDDRALAELATDADSSVRTHTMKLLAEREKFGDAQRALALIALKDADPWVQRNAADALGQHPAIENVRPLIALRNAAPA